MAKKSLKLNMSNVKVKKVGNNRQLENHKIEREQKKREKNEVEDIRESKKNKAEAIVTQTWTQTGVMYMCVQNHSDDSIS